MPLDDDPESSIDLAQASEVTGESDPDHNTVSLTVLRRNGRRATLSIPAADLQRLVPLLLLGRTLRRSPAKEDAPLSLVPTDSLHVGLLPSGETLLAIGIGPATVGLSLPAAAAEKLGRSLLAASAPSAKGPTSIQ
jgi:hypothetical protein